MAQKFPYTPSVAGLIKFLDQLRRSYPATVDAGLLKKLGIAPNNESYTINIAKFLGLFNEDGSRNVERQRLFSVADEEKFRSGFSEVVKEAYGALFELHGEGAWELDRGPLSTFFRTSDGTSAVVGDRQVGTFTALAEYAARRSKETGRRSNSHVRSKEPRPRQENKSKAAAAKSSGSTEQQHSRGQTQANAYTTRDIGISVKVEVILPAQADKETYDNIFRSIREHLIA